MAQIAVILCTYNPRREYIERTLAALRAQSLPVAEWELLFVDNASTNGVPAACDLAWHPQAKRLHEAQPGKVRAFLLGVDEARSPLMVMVDDDNVLAPDYLAQALDLGGRWPQLGAWGGLLVPEFEAPPPAWAVPHLANLTLYSATRDLWSNHPDAKNVPPGAGLCFREAVARKYASMVRSDPRRLGLDRCGARLTNCGDTDLALTAVDMGLGTGRFTCLSLTHLIPARRLTLEYLADFIEQTTYSFQLLHALRPEIVPQEPVRPQGHYRRRAYNLLRKLQIALLPREEKVLHRAAVRGTLRGNAEVAKGRASAPLLNQ